MQEHFVKLYLEWNGATDTKFVGPFNCRQAAIKWIEWGEGRQELVLVGNKAVWCVGRVIHHEQAAAHGMCAENISAP